MPSRPSLESGGLFSWDEAQEMLSERPSLLLGNGASRAIWEGFSYESLFKLATDDVGHALSEPDIHLFQEFGTRDFETVLAAINTARRVFAALGRSASPLRERYVSVQRALRDAVAYSHVPWTAVPEETLILLRDGFGKFGRVFTTNYDLIAYWAVMQTPPDGTDFVDFFWAEGNRFDPWNIGVHYSSSTQIFYPHGAIHLRREADGRTRKVVSHEGEGLLDAFQVPFKGDETPLFVSEGSASEKERVIRSSDYLSFALDQLSKDETPLVILGHALGDQDSHIARAVGQPAKRPIAIGIRGRRAQEKKLHYVRVLPAADLIFFDSQTHPLTAPDLRTLP